jgi:hypothetical protein
MTAARSFVFLRGSLPPCEFFCHFKVKLNHSNRWTFSITWRSLMVANRRRRPAVDYGDVSRSARTTMVV